MKKTMLKKICVRALSIALCVCMASVAYVQQASAEVVPQVGAPVAPQEINSVAAKESVIVNSVTLIPGKTQSSVIIPLQVDMAGELELLIKGLETSRGVDVGVFPNTACQPTDIMGTEYLSNSTEINRIMTHLDKPGTYYVRIKTSEIDLGNDIPQQVIFGALIYPEGGDLAFNKTILGASPKGGEGYAYYKIHVPSTGYVSVTFPSVPEELFINFYKVKITDSNKNAYYKYDKYDFANDSTKKVVFAGLKKGTYYIAVATSNKYYAINAAFHKVSGSPALSRKKAKTLKKKKTVKGVIQASAKQDSSHWYKFKVKKTQIVKFVVTYYLGGDARSATLQVFNKKSKTSFGYKILYNEGRSVLSPYTLSEGKKLKKGTYYIKITKTSDANGFYSVKWK